MKGEKTDPSARVNGILVRVIPSLGHMIRDVVNRDHPVGEDQDDEDENGECKIAQKVHGSQSLLVESTEFPPPSLFDRLNSHTQRQCLLDFSRTKKASIKFAVLCRTLHPCQCRDRSSPQLSEPGKARITLAPIAAQATFLRIGERDLQAGGVAAELLKAGITDGD
jgi:hypothetical protein